MWKLNDKTDKLGFAVWSDTHGSVTFGGPGGAGGIGVFRDDQNSLADADRLFRFETVDDSRFPNAAEHFVRGKQLHVHYPQADEQFGIRIQAQPIHSTASHIVLELAIAVETDSLDLHPKVDLVTDAGLSRDLQVSELSGKGGAPGVSFSTTDDATTAILLGPHDAPFTADQSTKEQVRLRLFGDFLEKGVIRKARPWLVIDRDGSMTDSQLHKLWNELMASPLPLTA